MFKLYISKVYILTLRLIEAFIISLLFAILLIAIYPLKILLVALLSSIPFIIYILNSVKYLKDTEIAWLYEFKYKELKEALISYVELKIDSIYQKIPFEKLNPFSIYRFKFELLFLLLLSFLIFFISFNFRKPIYIAHYGNYIREVKVEGNDEYFVGEDVVLRFINRSYLDENVILKPSKMNFKIKALSEAYDTIKNLDEGNYYLTFLNKKIFEFKVFQRPVIDSLLVLVYTPHLNLSQKFKNTYEVSAIEGSKVDIKLYSNADRIEPFISYSFIPKSDTQIEFKLYKSKRFYKYPNILKITLIKDNPPLVKIVYPQGLVYLPEDAKIDLFGIFLDDYGIKSVEILVNNKVFYSSKPQNVLGDSIVYKLDLSNEKMLPGDEIKVELRVRDLKNQIASDFITIRFPTLAEQMNLSNETISQNKDKIEYIRQKLEDLNDIIKRSDTKSDLKLVSEQLKQVENQIKELKENIDETVQKIQLDPEIQEQLKRIAELYDKIMNDELKQILRKIEQALNKVDREEIRKQLENIKLDIEKLKKSLKATEMTLRKFYEEQKLKELSEKLKELANMQENVKNKQEQSKITNELNDVKKNLDDISNTIEKPFSDSLNKISNELQSTINQSKNIEENWPNSQGFCSSNAKNIRNLGERLENLQNQLVENRKEEIIKKIESLRRGLIFISQNEDTKDEFEQKAILEAIKISIRDFEELAIMNFLIAIDIKANLYMALENAQEVLLRYKYNDYKRAKSYKNAEKKEILSAILKLYNAQNEVANASSSSGYGEMLKKLGEMANQMQSMNNQSLSDGLLKQILAQQEMLRRMIQGMKEGIEKTGRGKEYSEKLREIENEINELKREIENKKKIDRRIIQKQREIMHKLLEAYEGLKTKEKIQKYEAERPKDIKYEKPKISENMIYRQKVIEVLRNLQRIDLNESEKTKLMEFYQNLLKQF